MKRRLAPLTLIAAWALVVSSASAQSPTAPTRQVTPATKTGKAPAKAPKTLTAAAPAHAAAAPVTVTAAGSVIVLADGIVANAAMVQVAPPADGFVYER